MSEERLLTPLEAEAIVDEYIDHFGLAALPRVTVTALADQRWRVRWEDSERSIPPMTPQAWRAWLEENVGTLDPGSLQTTES